MDLYSIGEMVIDFTPGSEPFSYIRNAGGGAAEGHVAIGAVGEIIAVVVLAVAPVVLVEPVVRLPDDVGIGRQGQGEGEEHGEEQGGQFGVSHGAPPLFRFFP